MNVADFFLDRIFPRQVDRRIQAAVKVVDDKYWRNITDAQLTARPWREVRDQIEKVIATCLVNPLADRILTMTTEFVIGSWIKVEGPPWVHAFWHDPQNDLAQRAYRWCQELARTGELFIVLSRNPISKMSYLREVPALQIDHIRTDPDDLEKELAYHQLTPDPEGKWWPSPLTAHSEHQVMVHHAVNRDVGEVRGMSDLAQVLTWLDRYDTWLEDRVRINRYKGAYLWQVQIDGALPGQLEAKRAQYSRVPTPGSIIVTDGNETWTAVQPNINAEMVADDGRAIRLMIAAGTGIPLHFLAEGEATTLATAKEMGTPTFRRYAHRQYVFEHILTQIITTAAQRAGQPKPDITIQFESVLTELQAQPGAGTEQQQDRTPPKGDHASEQSSRHP